MSQSTFRVSPVFLRSHVKSGFRVNGAIPKELVCAPPSSLGGIFGSHRNLEGSYSTKATVSHGLLKVALDDLHKPTYPGLEVDRSRTTICLWSASFFIEQPVLY